MSCDTKNKLSRVTVLLHWIVGIAVIGALTIGVCMVQNKAGVMYPWHMSFGQLIFIFVLMQIVWRLKNGWPEAIHEYPPVERTLARVVHCVLLIGVLLMPIFGFLMASFSGNGVAFFGLELVARNPDPVNLGKVIPINGSIAGFAHTAHWVVGYTLIAAVILHIAGAVKHQVIDKDSTLRRMLGAEV